MRRSTLYRAAAACIVVAMGGCSDPSPPALSLRGASIPWRFLPSSRPSIPAVAIRTFTFRGEELAAWKSPHLKGCQIGPEGVTFAGERSQNVLVFRQTSVPAAKVSTIEFDFECAGVARLSVDWVATTNDGVAKGSIPFALGPEMPTRVAIDVAGDPNWRGRIDGLIVKLIGRDVVVRLDEVRLVDAPPAIGESADGRLFIAGEGRDGGALLADESATLDFGRPGVGPSQRVSFAVGLRREPPEASPPLALRIVAGGTESVQSIVGRGWHRVEWVCDKTNDPIDSLTVTLLGPTGAHVFLTDARVLAPLSPLRSRPNIVLITADTLRADFLAPYGDPITQTPNIDRLAARGTTFLDVTTAANVTLPSHTTILTGLYPKDHGCLSNTRILSRDLDLLPEVLTEQGYATGASIGSTVLSAQPTHIDQGFDVYYDLLDASRRDADLVTNDAIRFVDEHADEPFFLWVHYYDPHMPYVAPPDDVALYYQEDPRDPTRGEPIAGFDGVTDPNYALAQYRGEITSMDREIGRLLTRVESLGEAVVCFTADHGESLTEHQIFYNHQGLFPGTVMVPWVIAGPNIPAGVRVEVPVETVDIRPSMLSILGIPDRLETRGVARFPSAKTSRRDGQRFFQHANGVSVGGRGSRYHGFVHLIDHRRGSDPTLWEKGRVEIYDWVDDPDLLHDLSKERVDLTSRFRQATLSWLAEARGHRSEEIELTPSRKEWLRELGYLDGD